MLYEQWKKIARRHRGELAVRDLATGDSWTFGELDRQTEAATPHCPRVMFPQGQTVEFVRTVLRAWRNGAALSLLDEQELGPHPLPPGWLVKKTAVGAGPFGRVAFTPAQLQADARNIVDTMGLRPDWPNLGVVSLRFSYGFSNLVLPLLLHGIPLFLTPAPLPEILRDATKTRRNLTLPAVPALWRAWHKAKIDFHNVRLAISAAAPLPLALEREIFETQGLKIHNFYGCSECGGISFDDSKKPRESDSDVGRPLQNVRISVSPEGTLVIRSKAVGQTFWPDPDPALSKGRFQASDLGEVTKGRVFLRGHTSDQINVAGQKVSPAAIEEALREHKSVAECLVFGATSPDIDRREVIVACVTPKGDARAEDLKQFLLHRLPSWQVPRRWLFVKSLGADSRGKAPRSRWRSHFEMTRAQGSVGFP